jgi:hypothetical protein
VGGSGAGQAAGDGADASGEAGEQPYSPTDMDMS